MKTIKSSLIFEWDMGNIDHIAKHKVKPQEAEEVFFDKKSQVSRDIRHSKSEDRFIIIGKTKKNRLLYQVFTFRGNKMRIISSRDLNKKEVKLYEKKTNRS
jgi:uncharacterized DUF497 family protein